MNVSQIQFIALLIPLFPLLGFLLHFFLGDKIRTGISGLLASGWVFVSFLLSIWVFAGLGEGQRIQVPVFTWIASGAWEIPFAFSIDMLSGLMLLLVTGVGTLIHIYSVEYMQGDRDIRRYFSYLNLFVFFMLLLVMADNFVLLFAGWEGVGLCSYLLIGFWYDNHNYNNAANKAFIINRIGDLAFLLGLFLLFRQTGTFSFQEIEQLLTPSGEQNTAAVAAPIAPGILFGITLLLFLGATGKSAQIPLFTWLPDAMAGPTPVSALIHAATMVTAGIYLVLRNHLLFSLSHGTMDIIMVTGLATSLLAGIIALKQNDCKKILAYSTISQLGLIFFALGLGAFQAAFFHLITHAFFKALLFLAAGSVIHALQGQQDIRQMGGLLKKLPLTHLVFLTGVLAIIALPPFSGFFSKDAILLAAFQKNPVLWILGLCSGLITAWYMLRMYFIMFHNTARWALPEGVHIHEAGKMMAGPLVILAVLALGGGWLNVPALFHGNEWLSHAMEGIIPIQPLTVSHAMEWVLMGTSTLCILIVGEVARRRYILLQRVPSSDETEKQSPIQKWVKAKFYIDEFYHFLITKPLYVLSNVLFQWFDRKWIFGLVQSFGMSFQFLAGKWKQTQNGFISYYLFAMAIGMAGILVIFILI